MHRRRLMLAIASLIAPLSAVADQDDWREVLQRTIQQQSSIWLGHIPLPPDDPAWAEVDAILARAPSGNTTPIDVARYLANTLPMKYQRAWPEPDWNHPTYANPLIVRLFLATRTEPKGDTTAWCAAFVN